MYVVHLASWPICNIESRYRVRRNSHFWPGQKYVGNQTLRKLSAPVTHIMNTSCGLYKPLANTTAPHHYCRRLFRQCQSPFRGPRLYSFSFSILGQEWHSWLSSDSRLHLQLSLVAVAASLAVAELVCPPRSH